MKLKNSQIGVEPASTHIHKPRQYAPDKPGYPLSRRELQRVVTEILG